MPALETYPSSLKRHMWAGFAVAAALVGGVGVWAANTEISGAIIAPGLVVVESNVKKVQHPTGGVVGELLVREGDHVTAGEILLRLDATQTRANLGIVLKMIDELTAREARLEAEKVGADNIHFPEELLARANDPVVARLLAGEEKLFELRKNARGGQKAQLRERIAQLGKEIGGLTEQAKAKDNEIELLKKELQGVRILWEKQLIQITRVTALERDSARLYGERGQLIAAIAQANGKIAEVELQIIQVDGEMRSEVAQQLAEGRAKLSELSERKVTAEDQLKRIEIRAPQNGIVHQLTVHTIGGVVSPSEPIMLIVPQSDQLTVEARVAPSDIDQIRLYQPAALYFSAFSLRTTPEVPGLVSRIAADLSQDQKTGLTFYLVRLSIDETAIRRLHGLRLVPGMPVEVFIETESRSVISFLIKPLADQIARTFRET